MAYFKYKEKKYDNWSKLKEGIKRNPSHSPAHFVKGNLKRRIATKPKTSVLNYVS